LRHNEGEKEKSEKKAQTVWNVCAAVLGLFCFLVCWWGGGRGGKVQYLGLEQQEVFHRMNAKSDDLFWAEETDDLALCRQTRRSGIEWA